MPIDDAAADAPITGETRLPCPRCGERTPVVGRVCSHCGASTLVDVVADAAVEPRAAYAASRAVKDRWPEVSLVDVKRGLEEPGQPLRRDVTRREAGELAAFLAALGIGVATVAAADDVGVAASTRAPSRPLLVGVAAVAVLLLAFVLTRPSEDAGAGAGALPVAAAIVPTPGTPGPAATTLSPKEIAARALPSTVSVRCLGSLGSGFFVAPQLVVTNAHVLCDGADLRIVMADGSEASAVADRVEKRVDLALLRVFGARGTPLDLGDATRLVRGDEVTVVGNPQGLDFSVARGIVSHEARQQMGTMYFQVDANINPGNSGGPVLAADGRVVGIVTATVGQATGLGLALPVNYLFEDPARFVTRPTGIDSDTWVARLHSAEETDRREARQFEEALGQPALAAGIIAPTGDLLAVVLLEQSAPPAPDTFDFVVRRGRDELCRPAGTVREWHHTGDQAGIEDEQTLEWLERHGVEVDVYAGKAVLDVYACPPIETLLGAAMTLYDASEAMSSVRIEAW